MAEEHTLSLRVAEAPPKDVGRGLARLDPQDLERLGVGIGDVIEIRGKRAAVARVMPAYAAQRDQALIQMDGILRANAGASLDERVTVRRVEVQPARNVVLSPLEGLRASPGTAQTRYLAQLLDGIPVTTQDRVRVNLFGTRAQTFTVVETTPAGPVLIGPSTVIRLAGQGAKQERGAITYEDIGGLRRVIRRIREMIELPLRYPEVFERLGIDPPKGVLLHGPPGCGKTLIARAVAHETSAYFIHINGPEVIDKWYGASEANLRNFFDDARKHAPAIIFIDEIDALAPKREEMSGDRQVERRVVAQLLALMDGLESRGNVIVIAATNIPNTLDPALRRPGRFDREIAIGVPDRDGRREILEIHTRGMPLAADPLAGSHRPDVLTGGQAVNLNRLAAITHGFVGADLEALSREAAMSALRRIMPDIDFAQAQIPYELLMALEVTSSDFQTALAEVEPSAIREVFTEIPDVGWEDVGGLEEVKRLLIEAVEWPLRHAPLFEHAGVRPPKGILLHGAPGTGKTLLAKALASQSEVNFIAVKGPQLLSMWVGESLPYDEELLVLDGEQIFREKIGKIVEEQMNVQVVSFDLDGKVVFSPIDGHIKHPLDGKMLEVTTQTGRRIRVTDKHSLFSFSEEGIVCVRTDELEPGKSVIAVPSRIPNLGVENKIINLLDFFKEKEGFMVHNVTTELKAAIEKKGYASVASDFGVSVKYLYDIVGKNLPLDLRSFVSFVQKNGIEPDFSQLRVSVKGARNSLPALWLADADFWRLVGLWVAEGEFNNGVIRISATNPEIRSEIFWILSKWDVSISSTPSSIVVNSFIFQRIFSDVLNLRSGAFLKRVPAHLLLCDIVSVRAFLQGYFSGDGAVYGNDHQFVIEASTVSQGLANDLLYLFLKSGIVATCREKKEWSGSVSFRLRLMGVDNFRKFSEIGFIDSRRNTKIAAYVSSKAWERSNLLPLTDRIQSLLVEAFGSYPKNLSVGTRKLREALCQIDLSRNRFAPLWNLLEMDVYWDRVAEIREIEYTGFVYDVSVGPCQNFVGGFGGIFCHNSEKGVRNLFKKARQAAPCIVFFDEIEALAPLRGGGEAQVTERVVSQLLTELDGIEELKGVVVLAATNRLDRVDPALLRPGRFDFLVELPLPDRQARRAILGVHTRHMPLADDIDLEALAARTEGLVGADLEGLCHRAALLAIREYLEEQGVGEQESKEAGLPGAPSPLHPSSHAPQPPGTPAPLLKIAARHFEKALANRERQA